MCHVQDFYEDVFEELAAFGEIENLNVCDNLADHMVGAVSMCAHREWCLFCSGHVGLGSSLTWQKHEHAAAACKLGVLMVSLQVITF